MPGRLEQMLQLHTRLRYKVVFTFQVASISSIPPPPQSPGICRNKPGINSFFVSLVNWSISKANVHNPTA